MVQPAFPPDIYTTHDWLSYSGLADLLGDLEIIWSLPVVDDYIVCWHGFLVLALFICIQEAMP